MFTEKWGKKRKKEKGEDRSSDELLEMEVGEYLRAGIMAC